MACGPRVLFLPTKQSARPIYSMTTQPVSRLIIGSAEIIGSASALPIIGLGRIWSFVLGFRSLVARLLAFERGGTKPEGEELFGNGKCELIANFSATMVTSPGRERREVWREERKVRIFGKGKCKLIANCANFWQGKCKFIANFSATGVTSLPSLCLYLSLSLSLSPKVPHAQNRKRFRASYNTERERRKWRHKCRAKIGDEFTLSLAKNSQLAMSLHFPLPKIRTSRFSLHTSRLSLHIARAARLVIENPRQMIKSYRVLFCSSHRKTESINTKNYWK